MGKTKIGLGICGSYCTYEKLFAVLPSLCEKFDVQPIMTKTAATTDTRFGKAWEHIERIERVTGKRVLTEITEVEPLGPNGVIETLLIAPCTGNTLAKLAGGVTDSAVLMAAKGLLRNGKPVILAPFTNDGLSGSILNIGALLNRKNVYFVPIYQDDAENKPNSVASDLTLAERAVLYALEGRQLEPVLR